MKLNNPDRLFVVTFANYMARKPTINDYTDEGKGDRENCMSFVKTDFMRNGRRFLKIIAEAMCLTTNQYRLDYNKAGPAVSGDHTLHTDDIYISFNADFLGCWDGSNILYRTCQGLHDYTGGGNRYLLWRNIATDPERELQKLLDLALVN